MTRRMVVRAALAAASIVAVPGPAAAQRFESVGVRAQGMGGAFVAVANDATASWWNPAGLAGGSYVELLVEAAGHHQPRSARGEDAASLPAWRDSVRAVAVGMPALAFSYYRLRISEIQPNLPTVETSAGRQGTGTGEVRLRSLAFGQFGATVGQSLGEHVVLGTTLKLVRGRLGVAVRPAADASLDAADGLDGRSETHGDLDVGALAVVGRVRVGAALRNVTSPTFSDGADRVEVPRQARVGVALAAGRQRPDDLTVAVDADLTTTTTATGDDRRLAAGLEAWLPNRIVAVRGGFRVQTTGTARPAFSGGASLVLRRGVFVDGAIAGGSDGGSRGWSAGLRLSY